MKVKSFDFTFAHASKSFTASCTAFQVKGHHNYPMYRVVMKRGKNEDVYIYYKIDVEGQMFFWYQQPGPAQLPKSIAEGLEKYLMQK